MCLTASGWERIPLLINNVILGLDFCFFSVTEAQKWSFYSSVSISDAFKFDTLAGCAYVRLLILFQRFLEARVVRSESDGSFTLTLSVPELERAFGKKFKSKTKYRTKTRAASRTAGPFPPANVTWFLSRPPESSAHSSAGCSVALFSRLLCLCRLHHFFRARSSSLRHYLAPGSFPHSRKASLIFPTLLSAPLL